MDDMYPQMRFLNEFADNKIKSSQKIMPNEFMKALGFPPAMRNRYYDAAAQLGSVEAREGNPDMQFRQAFPNFIFRMAFCPLAKSKHMTELRHLDSSNKKTAELWKLYDKVVEMNLDAVEAEIPVVMMLRLPYYKTYHVLHNIDHEFLSLFHGSGNFFASKSDSGYWQFCQPLADLISLPHINNYVKEFIADEMGSSGHV